MLNLRRFAPTPLEPANWEGPTTGRRASGTSFSPENLSKSTVSDPFHTADIDANGVLNVSAQDKATGKAQDITITATTTLNENDVERLVREARQHEAEYRRRKEVVEACNTADQLIYQMEKTLRELGDQVSASDHGRIEGIIEDLKTAKEGDDAARIKQLIEQL
jgi:molecular chaperone DnaK